MFLCAPSVLLHLKLMLPVTEVLQLQSQVLKMQALSAESKSVETMYTANGQDLPLLFAANGRNVNLLLHLAQAIYEPEGTRRCAG